MKRGIRGSPRSCSFFSQWLLKLLAYHGSNRTGFHLMAAAHALSTRYLHTPSRCISHPLSENSTVMGASLYDHYQFFKQAWFSGKPVWKTSDMPDLTGKVMIVTGGNAGIGKGTVQVYHANTITASIIQSPFYRLSSNTTLLYILQRAIKSMQKPPSRTLKPQLEKRRYISISTSKTSLPFERLSKNSPSTLSLRIPYHFTLTQGFSGVKAASTFSLIMRETFAHYWAFASVTSITVVSWCPPLNKRRLLAMISLSALMF